MAWTHATGLDGLTRGLSTATGSGRPGEVSNRDDEEAVAAVGNTSQGVVPSGECSQETEETTRLDDGSVGLASRVPLQVTNTKQQEGQVQEQEEAEEGDSGPQGAEQQDGGEDEPAQQVQSHRVVEHGGATGGFNRRLDLEPTGGQDNGERDPETSVGGQSSGTEGVSDSHFPHASKQLNETTISESQTNDNVVRRDTTGSHVDQTQEESGEGESAETQRRRVGELALLDRLVQTRLEFTSEGAQVGLLGVDVSHGSVAETRSSSGGFLSGQLMGQGSTAVAAVLRSHILLNRVFSRHDDYREEIIRSRIKRYRREIDYNGLRSKSNPASWTVEGDEYI
jgi:hypothetical protein